MNAFKARSFGKKALLFLALLIALLFFVFPMYWIITMSFKQKTDILVTVPHYIPRRLTLTNYAEIFRKTNFPIFLLNSVRISIATTLMCVLVAGMAGFGLTRYRFRGSRHVSTVIYIIRMIPGLIYTVPLYLIFNKMGLIDNHWGLIAAYCTFSLPMSIWMFMSFYEEIPREIYESALLDGASEYKLFQAVALPLVAPSISVVAILCFLGSWNEFGLALTLTFSDQYKTLPVSINLMIQREADIPFGSIAAAGTLAMVPAIVLSLTSQKYIVKGFTAGAVKG